MARFSQTLQFTTRNHGCIGPKACVGSTALAFPYLLMASINPLADAKATNQASSTATRLPSSSPQIILSRMLPQLAKFGAGCSIVIQFCDAARETIKQHATTAAKLAAIQLTRPTRRWEASFCPPRHQGHALRNSVSAS